MDRNALILYLRNLRDLEVVKYVMEQDWIEVEEKYRKDKLKSKFRDRKSINLIDMPVAKERKGESSLAILIFLSLFLICFGLTGTLTRSILPKTMGAVMLGIGVLLVVFTVIRFKHINGRNKKIQAQYQQEVERIQAHNNRERERIKNEQQELLVRINNKFSNDTLVYNKNLEQVDQLLGDFYSMNILPSQYRTLPAVCYIYDYMSTSQASLQDTLIHEHMENGIVRLEQRLDEIMERIEDVVFETRCIRDNTEEMVKQNNEIIKRNNEMLLSLQRMESDANLAVQYAELSANYSKANAYFSAANYLKR